jgi:uncharacterized phage-like protein YoqJ
MKVAITAHHQDKLGGYCSPLNPLQQWIVDEMYYVLEYMSRRYEELVVISGMAQGVDTWAVEICLLLDIPYIAAVPFEGQELLWPVEKQYYYHELLGLAKKVHIIEPVASKRAYWIRNHWMVREADRVLAVWNGEANTDTGMTVRYARSLHHDIHIINPNKFKPKRRRR